MLLKPHFRHGMFCVRIDSPRKPTPKIPKARLFNRQVGPEIPPVTAEIPIAGPPEASKALRSRALKKSTSTLTATFSVSIRPWSQSSATQVHEGPCCGQQNWVTHENVQTTFDQIAHRNTSEVWAALDVRVIGCAGAGHGKLQMLPLTTRFHQGDTEKNKMLAGHWPGHIRNPKSMQEQTVFEVVLWNASLLGSKHGLRGYLDPREKMQHGTLPITISLSLSLSFSVYYMSWCQIEYIFSKALRKYLLFGIVYISTIYHSISICMLHYTSISINIIEINGYKWMDG